ncbi:MAG: extracellular solute-binding protein [Eubacteriales bacterium]|nr:extracellular solute-binding protein [Eubacteriales bacterium]
MKKKAVATFLCGVMALSVLAGCGSSSAPAAETADSKAAGTSAEAPAAEAPAAEEEGKEAASGEGVTISFLASQDWVYDAERELAAKFEEETGIKVDYQIVPADQYYNVLMTKLNSGEGPDIFGGQSGSYDIVSQYNVEENAVDLSNEPWVEYYNEFAKEQTSTGGKVYGATYFDTTTDFYMVYNKKIFEENGVAVPTSFAEFEDVCQKLLDAGITPIYEPDKDGWHATMWFCEIGGKYQDIDPDIVDKLNNNEVKFADVPMFKEALEDLNDLAQKGYFGDNYLSDEYADTVANLASGEYAMSFEKPGQIAAIAAASDGKYTEDDFGLFLCPNLDNDVLNVHPCGPTRFIYSGSSHIEEAKKYLAYITTKESVQYMIDNEPKIENLPYNLDQTPAYSATTREFIDSQAKSGTVFQDVIKYLNPQWMQTDQDIISMFTGEKTAEDVLKAIDDRRTEQAQAAGDTAW